MQNLDQYLERQGFSLSPVNSTRNEGYTSIAQREAFAAELKKHREIRRIAEIGFNAGHTAELFLTICPNAEVVSFDLNDHPYTKIGIEYISSKFQGRFTFVEGDSRQMVPAFVQKDPRKFDLIFIDGGHTLDVCFPDIQNCRQMAHPNTLVWIDDYYLEDVFFAAQLCQEQGLIKIIQPKAVSDSSGYRFWVEAQFL